MSGSPLILAVECATRVASVAIARGDALCCVRAGTSEQHHAESLLGEVDAALREAGVGLPEVDAFAVTLGPGAFTSLRIGLATIKGLAFGSGRPVAALSTLAVVAHAAPPGCQRVAAVLDARRGEVYAGEFDRSSGSPVRVGDEAVENAEALVARLGPETGVVGEWPAALEEALAAAGRADRLVSTPADAPPRAAALASLALPLLERGEGIEASALAPRYLRRAEAEEKRLASGASLDTPQGLQ